MLKLLGAVLSVLLLISLAPTGAMAQFNESPSLRLNGILLTNQIGVGGIQIAPPDHFKPRGNNVLFNGSENLKSVYNINANISQVIYSPVRMSNINESIYAGLITKDVHLNNSILYQITYKGERIFRFLIIVETVSGFTNYTVNGFENFSSMNLTGQVVYQLNFANGQKNMEVYIQGMIYKSLFTYLMIKNFRNLMKIYIVIPISNFSQFTFQELETGNYNLSAPVSPTQSSNFGIMEDFIIGIIIGLAILSVIFTIYRKKD